MKETLRTFEERVQEINDYLDLVDAVEKGIQQGAPFIGKTEIRLTVTQQKVLYSSTYLHLYNLVEATVSLCIAAVEKAASVNRPYHAGDLSTKMRREWARSMARTHVPLSPENRLDSVVELCDQIVGMLPIDLKIDTGGGGNWDDVRIDQFSRRLGIELNISNKAVTLAKRHIRDDMGALVLIKTLRNKLAHGEISFGECGDGLTANELKEIRNNTVCYLREVITSFTDYIEQELFLSK